MPEVTIHIGGRDFQVACQEGEEQYLHAAAKMLDDEAQVLTAQVGRMPEARMLLMAGLMLADKTASMEDQVAAAQGQLAEREAEIEGLRNVAAPEPERIEVPVVPDAVTDALAELAAQAEALAAQAEERSAPAE
ncbi:MAG: cell division protein ZapA [Pseudomonadota bacterium]